MENIHSVSQKDKFVGNPPQQQQQTFNVPSKDCTDRKKMVSDTEYPKVVRAEDFNDMQTCTSLQIRKK